jgi:hypothetical protein
MRPEEKAIVELAIFCHFLTNFSKEYEETDVHPRIKMLAGRLDGFDR